MTLLLPRPTLLASKAPIAKDTRWGSPPLIAPPSPSPREVAAWMHPEHSLATFRSMAADNHLHVDDLTASDAFRLMMTFYRELQASGCSEHDRGDMLLCEWGLFKCGEQDLFHFEISRQFTEDGDGEAAETSLLTVGLHYKPTFTLRAIPPGELWCRSRSEADAFEQEVRAHDVFWSVATVPPAEVALEWNLV